MRGVICARAGPVRPFDNVPRRHRAQDHQGPIEPIEIRFTGAHLPPGDFEKQLRLFDAPEHAHMPHPAIDELQLTLPQFPFGRFDLEEVRLAVDADRNVHRLPNAFDGAPARDKRVDDGPLIRVDPVIRILRQISSPLIAATQREPPPLSGSWRVQRPTLSRLCSSARLLSVPAPRRYLRLAVFDPPADRAPVTGTDVRENSSNDSPSTVTRVFSSAGV